MSVFMPNYLKVSRRKKYFKFYVEANNFMAQDYTELCFRALRINRDNLKKYRVNQKTMKLRQAFIALKE